MTTMTSRECHLWSVSLTALWLKSRGRKEFVKTWVHALWSQGWRCSDAQRSKERKDSV